MNASSIKHESHLKEEQHFLISDGLGSGTKDLTYLGVYVLL